MAKYRKCNITIKEFQVEGYTKQVMVVEIQGFWDIVLGQYYQHCRKAYIQVTGCKHWYYDHGAYETYHKSFKEMGLGVAKGIKWPYPRLMLLVCNNVRGFVAAGHIAHMFLYMSAKDRTTVTQFLNKMWS